MGLSWAYIAGEKFWKLLLRGRRGTEIVKLFFIFL